MPCYEPEPKITDYVVVCRHVRGTSLYEFGSEYAALKFMKKQFEEHSTVYELRLLAVSGRHNMKDKK